MYNKILPEKRQKTKRFQSIFFFKTKFNNEAKATYLTQLVNEFSDQKNLGICIN
jgi:hypothetical protein